MITLEPWQRATLVYVIIDAIRHREPAGACGDCASPPEVMCPVHAADWTLAQSYKALAASLEITLFSP